MGSIPAGGANQTVACDRIRPFADGQPSRVRAEPVDALLLPFAARSRHRGGKGLCGRGLRRELKRSALRADCPVLLDSRAHGKTRYAGCARCAQTAAVSQSTKRAARATLEPALLGAS